MAQRLATADPVAAFKWINGGPIPDPQRADQVGILGKALDQNRARPFERGGGIGHALVGIDKGPGGNFRILLRLRDQPIGELEIVKQSSTRVPFYAR